MGDSNIRENKYKIDSIFHNYDKNYLKLVDPNILIIALKKIHCTNPMIKKQMESLNHNIKVFEKIEKEYRFLDNFVVNNTPDGIAIVCNNTATVGQILTIIKQLSNINNISEIESILNQFCLLRSANIYGKIPNCNKCKLKNFCKQDKFTIL